MKKLILGAIALMMTVSFVSCKDTEKKIEEVAEKVTETVEGVPSFSDPAVQEYVNLYEEYIKEYTEAAEKKDMAAFANLGTKGQELGTKAQEIAGKISGDDVKKWTDYMTSTSKKLQELSAKFTQ